ncbi:MAG: hypothetical protein E7632_05650 [Ruminococcaceae bacterium]|nr:hypothetical protein [Oscillospiraceae bacterium]
MSFLWKLSFHSPFFAVVTLLAVAVGILLIVNPKLCLRRRSGAIPKKSLRNVRILGIVLLALVVIVPMLVRIVTSI